MQNDNPTELPPSPPSGMTELLSTKLAPPRPHSSLVPRASLLARLDEGLERKLTLLSAPPGFGKTTLMSEWIATRHEPAAWVSLDNGDDDPARFWYYVISACRAFDAALGRSALAVLRTSQQPSFETLLTTFINELAQLQHRSILVLEDYHVISSPEVHSTLTFLLDHLPATLHLVLMTRSEPPLPLARLRVRNELNELTAADLRFSTAETQTFLQHTLGASISPEAMARIEERTEGWVAGLRLMTLALQSQPGSKQVEPFLTTFTGGHRHVLEYLVGDVLAAQPAAWQTFLLQTSFLKRLTGSLCDAITGREDSAMLLEQLEHANLFLIALGGDDGRPWYRYHSLFAEAMHHHARQRLGEAHLRVLYDKAAQWYEAHGLLAEAVEALFAAQTFERAAGLIDHILEERPFFEWQTLQRWIEQLPKAVLDAHPVLSFNYAMLLLFTSDRFAAATAAAVEVPLQAAEHAWRTAQDDEGLGKVLALRGLLILWQDDLTRAFACAREALELLPEYETYWRGISLFTVGIEELLTGKIDSTQRILMEARALCEAAQNMYAATAATLYLGEAYLQQAELAQAEQLYQQVLTDVKDQDSMQDDRCQAEIGLGTVAFERNDLRAAEAHATRALEMVQQFKDERLTMLAQLLQARLQQARGQIGLAQETLRALAARLKRVSLLREIYAWQARFALTAGDLAAVHSWAAAYPQHTDGVSLLQQEQEALTLARLHVAEDQPDLALEILERWRVDAHAHGRVRSELEILCLKALAYFAQSDHEHAHKTLIRALTIAQPKGYLRVFLDEGENLAVLLQAITPDLKKRPLVTYVTLLLRAFASSRSTSTISTSSPLLEPLSQQEQRVLRLLAAGLSNPEIARELVVSTNTIKTQVQSIYRKLNVKTREDAAEIARQLKLA